MRLPEGATIFTGETGSGKTMILGALAFALGSRASADVVRRGAAKAAVTLAFDPDEGFAAFLTAAGFEVDPGEEATIVREMNDAGKSSVRVNGRSATASYVREIAGRLAEIVGQHEAQRLLVPSFHLHLLDRFGGSNAALAREAVAAAHATVSTRARELHELQSNERKAEERYADERFALEEIEDGAPQAGEDRRLTERRRYLDNAERILASLRAAHEALAGDEGSASSAFGAASSALDGIADIAGELSEMASQARALQSEATELAVRIAREADSGEFDAGELETINTRLDVLDKLKRKYGATLERVLERAEEARAIVSAHESRDERHAELHEALLRAQAHLGAEAGKLTAIRMKTAQRLSRGVVAELKELALPSAQFDCAFTSLEPIGAEGAENVEFTFAANAGEQPRPLARVASGGELSRVLLALVVVLASARERSALIFDEIDAGIGGATATAVGTRLGKLARDGQVVCVTHLAQLATWADRHYILEKREAKGNTTIAVREITGEEKRAAELARMLSGESHDIALEHARTLLRQATRVQA